MKSLGVYNWYVKMPRCRCVEHGLEYFSFYVQKHIAHLAACSQPPAGLRRAARGTRISETRLLKGIQGYGLSSISTGNTSLALHPAIKWNVNKQMLPYRYRD